MDESMFHTYEKILDQRIRDLSNKIADVQNNLKSTDNYLEKYLPFNTFCQLFEVLRLTLENVQINKVKDYEEYRLKELYDIILTDQGDTKTNFDKKYVIQPLGYNFDNLAQNETRINSKSKRFIMGRPSFTSSVKLDEKGIPILDLMATNNRQSFYGIGAKFQKSPMKKKSSQNNAPEIPLLQRHA